MALVARHMDTWPDELELPPGEEDRPYYEIYPRAWTKCGWVRWWRPRACFARDAATEWERPQSPAWTFPVQWLRYQTDFPQVGIIIDRLSRVIGNERRAGKRGVLITPMYAHG